MAGRKIYSQSGYQKSNFPCHASARLHPSQGNTSQRKDETVTFKEEVLNCGRRGRKMENNSSPSLCLRLFGWLQMASLLGPLETTQTARPPFVALCEISHGFWNWHLSSKIIPLLRLKMGFMPDVQPVPAASSKHEFLNIQNTSWDIPAWILMGKWAGSHVGGWQQVVWPQKH